MTVRVFTERNRRNNRKEWGCDVILPYDFVKRDEDTLRTVVDNVNGHRGKRWHIMAYDGDIIAPEPRYSVSSLPDYNMIKEHIETLFDIKMPDRVRLGDNKERNITF